MPADRLLLVAQPESYRIAPYVLAARRMGLEVLIASRGKHSLISDVNNGLHIELDDPDQACRTIVQESRQRPFTGILGSDDSTVELAARVANELGLPHNPPSAARFSRRKDMARARLSAAGCPVPKHGLIDLERPLENQMTNLPWPCVIKPLNLSASRGVIRADDPGAFVRACERTGKIISGSGNDISASHVLVEEYIAGIEVAFEGFLCNGELRTLVVFDKPDPLEGPYFEETIYVTPSRLDHDTLAMIQRRVALACQAYGLTTGPVHAELRIDERDAWVLEVASRTIGGDCARTLDMDDGLNLEELAIALATGRPVRAEPPPEARGVMMIPIEKRGILRRVEGLLAASRVPHIDKIDIIAREGRELIPLPEGNQYPGYIFARADSPEEVVTALREAHARLNFVVAPLLRVTPG